MRWWKHLVVPDILTTYHEVVRALNHRRMPRPVFWLKEIELRVVKDHSVIGYGIVITPSPPKLMMDIHGDYRMDVVQPYLVLPLSSFQETTYGTSSMKEAEHKPAWHARRAW